MVKRIAFVVLALMLVLPIAAGGLAQEPAAKAKSGAVPASWKTETMVEETATVVAIDTSTRMVTLKSPDGKESTVKAGKHIQNLDLVKAGDQVRFARYAALAVRVLEKGEKAPATGEGGIVLRTKDEGKPGGFAMREKTALFTVESIDRKAKTATLKGEDGKSITVAPQDPKRLDQAKVGDRLEITVTEEVAVKVEKVEKKK